MLLIAQLKMLTLKRDFRVVSNPGFINGSLAVILYLFISFQLHPLITPNLPGIHLMDQSKFMQLAAALSFGKLPLFSLNPGIALFYLPFFYIAFKFQPDIWLPYMTGMGNQFILGFLVLGLYMLSERIDRCKIKLLPLMLAIWPIPILSFQSSSDSLFSLILLFVFVLMSDWWRNESRRSLFLISMFLSVSIFIRNDGFILIAAMFLAMTLKTMNRERSNLTRRLSGITLAVLLIPGSCFLTYLMAYSNQSGTLETGLAGRSYFAFEQGHFWSQLYRMELPDRTERLFLNSTPEVRRLFGSPDENNLSVLTAAFNHPEAFIKRVANNLMSSTVILWQALNLNGFMLFFLPVILIGIRGIVKDRRHDLLVPVLTTAAFLTVYPFFFFRHGYFMIVYFLFYLFVHYGVRRLLLHFTSTDLVIMAIILMIELIAVFLTHVEPHQLIFCVLLLLFFIYLSFLRHLRYLGISLLMSISIVMIVSWIPLFSHPWIHSEKTPEYTVSKILEQYVGPGNWVAAYGERECAFSFTHCIPIQLALWDSSTESDWQDFLDDNKPLRAVYLNPDLYSVKPELYQLIANQNGKSIELRYSDATGFYRIYTVVSKRE